MVLSHVLAAAVLSAAPKGLHEVKLGVDWVAVARGPATVSVQSFVPVKSTSPGITVYGFKLAPDASCRGETPDRVPQPDPAGKWGPFEVPKDRTLCVTSSAASGGVLKYSVK